MNTNLRISLPTADERLNELLTYLTENEIPFETRVEATKEKPQTSPKQLGQKGLQVLELLSKGKTYVQIAKELEITVDGVRYYIKKLYKVLNVSNSAEAVRYYIKHLE